MTSWTTPTYNLHRLRGGPVRRYCVDCGEPGEPHFHDIYRDYVRCPRHWHWIIHFVCRDCGHAIVEPSPPHLSDCVVPTLTEVRLGTDESHGPPERASSWVSRAVDRMAS